MDYKALGVKTFWWLLVLSFFGYLFSIALIQKLNDPDLWWHLKTGEYILEHGEVPDVDPFAYTTPRPLSMSQKIGLRAQWLGQVMLYQAYRFNGLLGVAIFRNLLIVMPMLLLVIWLVRNGARHWHAIALVSMPAFMLDVQLFYSFERPQGVSFNLVILSCILVNRIRRKATEGVRFDHAYWILPVMAAFWSNVHAGFIVGNLIICIYVFAETLKLAYLRWWQQEKTGGVKPVFFLVMFATLVATCLNPNTYHVFYNYASGLLGMFITDASRYVTGGTGGGWVKDVVLEFKPLIYFYTFLHYDWLVIYWIFSALTALTVLARFILRRELDLSELLTVGFVILFANMYARGLMFSLTVLPFYFAKNALDIMRVDRKIFQRAFRIAVASALALGVSFVVYTYRFTPDALKPAVTKSWVSPWYPIFLCDFIKNVKPAPPMYNYYTWGGYMIWSIYPEYKVFIDGRAIDNFINETADNILKAYPGWQQKLDVYNINFIAIPVIFRESGHIIPLATMLVDDPRWHLVFVGNNAALFVRDHPRNADIINRYAMDKRRVFFEIAEIEKMFLRAMPGNPVFNIALGQALMGMGRYAEAKAIFERFPRDAAEYLQQLRQMGY
jgi:hypothetical protein